LLGDEELHRLLDGDDLRGAGTWLVKRYAHEVHGLCSALIRDRLAAEDLAQDVFSRAFAGLGSYRREASSRTWLLAIARNRCIDHLRSQGRAPFSDVEPSDAADETPLTSELLSRRADVLRALGALDEGERALVILRYRHGLSYDELANVFGLKAGTTRMRVSRALSRMRSALERAEPMLDELAAPRAAPAPLAQSAARASGGVEEELESADVLEEAGAPLPASAPAGPPRRRAGLLSRIFGSKGQKEEKEAPAEEERAVARKRAAPEPSRRLGAAPPPEGSRGGGAAPPPQGPPPPAARPHAPAPGAAAYGPGGAPSAPTHPPHPLAAALRTIEPAVPAPFKSRLLDLASRL
jgi:RNA polymerase sigma-70 factor (ECF subfamily)